MWPVFTTLNVLEIILIYFVIAAAYKELKNETIYYIFGIVIDNFELKIIKI